ncbi:MAG: anti-sigma regulatory factor [Myxococcota bacterium]
MEIVQGSAHTIFPMDDPSRVGSARRHAIKLATGLAFSDVNAARLALVVTELGTNLVKHARGGRLLIASREHEEAQGERDIRHVEIEVLSIDGGPGITNLTQCMGDGFSTGGSPGTGLGAIKRLADEFDIWSAAPGGTFVVARVRAGTTERRPSAFRLGVVCMAKHGEETCGDGWIFASDGAQAAVLLADGLGHGPEAAAASRAALSVFRQKPFERLEPMLTTAHSALRMTRGAAVSAAHLDAHASSVRSVGAGNVMMRIVSGVSDRTLLGQHGTVGVQMRTPVAIDTPWPRHAVLGIHSDGIMNRWPGKDLGTMLACDPSLMAGRIARDYCRDRDDATIAFVRRKD